MLSSIQIKNFRSFRDLEVAPLRRVNLIIGQNNTGKTALLEALCLLLAQPNPAIQQNLASLFRVAGGQVDQMENFWKWLFREKNTDLPIRLKGSSATEMVEWLILKKKPDALTYPVQNLAEACEFPGATCYRVRSEQPQLALKAIHFSTQSADPSDDAIKFNRVVVRRQKKALLDLLSKLESRLGSLEALNLGNAGSSQSTPLIYAEMKDLPEMIPVSQLGQGFGRLLGIFSEVLATDAQVLLIDEIENGLHHSVLRSIWKGLFAATLEANLQVFATTHSWECILAADEAARASNDYELSLIRLDRVDGNTVATVMDDKTLVAAKELHWELR